MNVPSIREIADKIKASRYSLVSERLSSTSLLSGVSLILVALAAFGLGRLSQIEEGRRPVTIRMDATPSLAAAATLLANGPNLDSKVVAAVNTSSPSGIPYNEIAGEYVGAKKGHIYRLPVCPGAKSIKPSNRVWFATKLAAEEAGYTPASNCKGL